MTSDDLSEGFRAPERLIPIPRHLSPQAQAWLAMPRPDFAFPEVEDTEAWTRLAAQGDAMMAERFKALALSHCEVTERHEGAARAYEVTPMSVAQGDRRVCLDIHGGAFIGGAGDACRAMAMGFVGALGVRTVSVDYRMPPEHPYPAGLDDILAFYRALLRDHQPEEIIVCGRSAGGNLAAALLLRARDEGLPMPAAALLLSPELDLTESGDSFAVNAGVDSMSSLMRPNRLYAGGADLADPYLSPLFGDFTKGFPPTFLTTGTRDLFLSNTVRMHCALRAADVDAELYVMEAAAHSEFGLNAPEQAARDREIRRFCAKRWLTA
jgi:acetyl esterase/lipase